MIVRSTICCVSSGSLDNGKILTRMPRSWVAADSTMVALVLLVLVEPRNCFQLCSFTVPGGARHVVCKRTPVVSMRISHPSLHTLHAHLEVDRDVSQVEDVLAASDPHAIGDVSFSRHMKDTAQRVIMRAAGVSR